MGLTNGTVASDKMEKVAISRESELSPYSSQAISVRIGPNGASYTVLEAMLEQYPGLRARMNHQKPGAPIDLPEVDEDVAHTLLHFIYTRNYQSLGLGGISETARATAEFKRSILAYCAAQVCEIKQLEEVTQSKMEHFSGQISLFSLQEILSQVASRIPSADVWFPEHLYRWVKSTLQRNQDLLGDENVLHLVGRTVLFDRAIVRSITEMYCEKSAAFDLLSQGRQMDVAPTSGTIMPNDHQKTSGKQPEQANGVGSLEVAMNGHDVPKSEDGMAESTEVMSPASKHAGSPEQPAPTAILESDGATNAETELVPLHGESASNTREDELAKLDGASKTTDSDVENARAKLSNKKSKKKNNKKKSGSEMTGTT